MSVRYDEESADYRDLWAPVLRTAGLRLLSALGGAGTKRILDVGTGVGTLLPDLEAKFPGSLLVAVDRSAGMLRLAPSRFARVVMDAGNLAVASASVDLALLAFMLFHMSSPRDALAHVRRALRPGGRAGLVTWRRELASPAIRIWTDCLDRHGAAPIDPATETRHEALDSPGKLEALLRESGFHDVTAWDEELAHSIGSEHLLLLRTRMGSSRDRFESLGSDAQASCVAEARRRMGALGTADFVARGRVVYAVGRA
ncbi:MAG: class I SAM-dependent methyltransferase [Candidatus Eiseniibacteriota bacterium]